MNSIGTLAFGAEIAAAALRHHLNPRLLAAVAAQETGGPGADSGRNIVGDGGHGHGVFQIDDRYHPFAASRAAMDPARNAEYAAGILAGALRTNRGDVRKALSVYNAGSPTAAGTRTDWGDGKPIGYADSVLRHYRLLGGGPEPSRDTQLADWRETMPATNALQTASVALRMPPAHPAASGDRAKTEAALVTVLDGDAGDSDDVPGPSRPGSSS